VARPDVAAALGLDEGDPALPGFVLVAAPMAGRWSLLRRLGSGGTALGLDRALAPQDRVRLIHGRGGGAGHVDRLLRCRRANRLESPGPVLVEVSASGPCDAVLLRGGELVLGRRLARGRLRFRLPPGPAELVAAADIRDPAISVL
jgi:hypothetical protein